MDYNFNDIEKKWQAQWAEKGVYRVSNKSDKQPFYVLDMFPYPSGAGLHVGHPLGISLAISTAVTNACRASMSFTQWDSTPMVCLRSNMLSKQVNTLKKPQWRI